MPKHLLLLLAIPFLFRALVPLPNTLSRKSRPSLWKAAFPKTFFSPGRSPRVGAVLFALLCGTRVPQGRLPGGRHWGGSCSCSALPPDPRPGGIPGAASAGSAAPPAWRRPGVPERRERGQQSPGVPEHPGGREGRQRRPPGAAAGPAPHGAEQPPAAGGRRAPCRG